MSHPLCARCRQPLGGTHTEFCIWEDLVVPSECTGVIEEAVATVKEREAAIAEGRRLATAAIVADLRACAATPLADEIAALRARVADLEADLREADETYCKDAERAEKAEAEAERDEKAVERAALETTLMAFKARFTEVLAERDALRAEKEAGWYAPLAEKAALMSEVAALRAQVEAARTYARQSLDYGEDCDAHDLLDAMDKSKP